MKTLHLSVLWTVGVVLTLTSCLAFGAVPTRPRLFKSTNYPPQTAEEKAQWDWWRAMQKADPSFEWKSPIELYGRVVEQRGEPVTNATIKLTWTTAVGPRPDPEKRIVSGENGLFTVSGIQGKFLCVDVLKQGYLPTKDSSQGFEYSDFSDKYFHVPDRDKPVVFRLRKLMGAEPMYKFLPCGEVTVGGAPLVVSAERGKVGQQGDFACSVALGEGRGRFDAAHFTITLTAQNGAGLSPSSDEFLFNAPESGYQSTLVRVAKAADPDFRWSQTLRFYLKTSGGKYAAAEVEVALNRKLTTAVLSAIIYYNPSGSRNLEFDSNKMINP